MKTADDYLATCSQTLFGERVIEDLKKWRAQLVAQGLLDVWTRNYRQYNGGNAETGDGWASDDPFSIMGDNGEILSVRLNESRNLVTNMLNLTYAKPIGLRCVATNADPGSMEAAQIGDSRLTEVMAAASGGKLQRNLGEIGLVVTTAFADAEWDLFAGEAYLPTEDGGQAYTGAPRLSERWPDEVRFDLSKRRWEDVWGASVIQRANRYILASQYPDHAEKILSVPSINDSEFCSLRYADETTDDILVVKYQHRPVNSRFLPSGRYGLVLEDATVLRDGDSPYALVGDGRLGLFPITASSGMGSVYGYPIMNDLSPLQQWLNLVATMIATLVAGYGAPNISGPALLQMDIQQMVGGGRYFGLKSGQGEVKPLNLLPDLKPLFELMQLISSTGEKLSGMNSVVRGGAERDMSGKAVALWKSMAVQFMSSFMQSAIEQAEGVGDYVLRLDQTFATGEQTIARVGEDNAEQVVKYHAADTFRNISKVRAQAVDPVAMTPEGREERAQFLMDKGLLPQSSVKNYLTLVETGRDEPMLKAPTAQLMLIQRENSDLLKGIEPIVLEDDDHVTHGPEHAALTANPEVRNNPDVLRVILEHKAKHKLFEMGITPMQGDDPATGMPYPSAIEQLAQAKAEADAAAAQASMTQVPQGGEPSATEAPAPQGGSGPQPQQAQTMQDQMQASAMGPPT